MEVKRYGPIPSPQMEMESPWRGTPSTQKEDPTHYMKEIAQSSS